MISNVTFGYSELIGAALAAAMTDEFRTDFTCDLCAALCDACVAVTRHSVALSRASSDVGDRVFAVYDNVRKSIEQARVAPPDVRGEILKHASGAMAAYVRWIAWEDYCEGPSEMDPRRREQILDAFEGAKLLDARSKKLAARGGRGGDLPAAIAPMTREYQARERKAEPILRSAEQQARTPASYRRASHLLFALESIQSALDDLGLGAAASELERALGL